jgi:hypothetical protein
MSWPEIWKGFSWGRVIQLPSLFTFSHLKYERLPSNTKKQKKMSSDCMICKLPLNLVALLNRQQASCRPVPPPHPLEAGQWVLVRREREGQRATMHMSSSTSQGRHAAERPGAASAVGGVVVPMAGSSSPRTESTTMVELPDGGPSYSEATKAMVSLPSPHARPRRPLEGGGGEGTMDTAGSPAPRTRPR